uniref:SH3_10 domain-containing protein n=1 Tax=Mesocestoides corti TaxID=53468 RepID=A0A5K3F3X7_MESCO
MSKSITSSIFKAFKPYDELLFECTSVLTELCSSIWLHNVPACSAVPEKTVLRFRARQSSQDFPLILLAAFKHHMENISKLGESILALRKALIWIEEQECELGRISDIFHWNGGLVALANDIRKQHEIVLTTIKVMDKLGALTYRVSTDHHCSYKPPTFKVKAIAEVNQPEMGCTIESGQMYTVVDQKNPYIWKLAESGQFVPSIFLEPTFSGPEERLCERVQNQLDSFKAKCLIETCKVLVFNLNKPQNQARSGPTFHFPLTPIPPTEGSSQSSQLPQDLRDALITYLEQIGKDEVSWEPVDRFWQWYITNTGEVSKRQKLRHEH